MHVLLTGASGFVGSHVLERLLTGTDYHVTVVASFRHDGTADRVADVVRDDVARRLTVLRHDLAVPIGSVLEYRLRDVDVVVNCASRSSVDESIVRPAEFVENNVLLTLNTVEMVRRVGVERFIHLSTDEVYGPLKPAAPHAHLPSSPYAASKAAQEEILHAYAQTYGMTIGIVTSANMFGERQSQRAFIPKLIRQFQRDEEVTIHVTDRGKPGSRSYTYVGNVAQFLVDLTSAWPRDPRSSTWPRRYALTGQQTIDNLALANVVAHLASDHAPRFRLRRGDLVRPGYDVSYEKLDAHPAWKPEVSFIEGIEKTVGWFLDNPEWLDD